jgi:hypothetical protein
MLSFAWWRQRTACAFGAVGQKGWDKSLRNTVFAVKVSVLLE